MSESPVVYNLDGGSSGSGGCGNGGMFGNGDGSWLFAFLIIALIFGDRLGLGNNGNNGGASAMPTYIPMPMSSFGGFNASGALTRADLCSEFAFNDLNRAVEGLNSGLCNGFYTTSSQLSNGFAGVNNAICSLGYNNAQLANGINTTMMQGFNSANIVALQNQNALQAQIAQCCCDQKAATADLKYTIASEDCTTRNLIQNSTRDLIENQNAGVRSILDYLCQEKIADLQSENQGLRLAASQSAQNQYLISQLRPFPVAAYQVCNPFTGTYGGYQGYGSGCGCNSGCGC